MNVVLEGNSTQTKGNLLYVGLLDQQMRERLSARLCREKGFTPYQSDEVVDGTLGFLKLCAAYPHYRFSPSPIVDIGWHEFLMYTREYQEFCQRVAGRFIHHSPNDLPGRTEQGLTMRATRDFMVAHGILFHADQWQLGGGTQMADCNNHCENNAAECDSNCG